MSDIVFPAGLPAPLADGYSVTKGDISSTMPTDSGIKRVRPRFRSAPDTHTLTWKFSPAQYVVFDSFYENDLAAGSKPFLCPLDDGSGGLNAQLMIFLEPPSEVVDDGLNYRVSVKVLQAGPPLGKFPNLVKIDGASGGVDLNAIGSGGSQSPTRAIKLSNYTLSNPVQSGLVTVVINTTGTGRLILVDTSGQKNIADEWRAAANTTANSEYGYSALLTVLDYRDAGTVGPNNPSIYSTPPVDYVGTSSISTVQAKSADVSSITAFRQTSVRATSVFPWVKYLLTIRVKDQTSGYVATGLFTIEVGTKPSGRTNS